MHFLKRWGQLFYPNSTHYYRKSWIHCWRLGHRTISKICLHYAYSLCFNLYVIPFTYVEILVREHFFALMALCEENPMVTGGSHHKESVSFCSLCCWPQQGVEWTFELCLILRQHGTHVIVLWYRSPLLTYPFLQRIMAIGLELYMALCYINESCGYHSGGTERHTQKQCETKSIATHPEQHCRHICHFCW